MKTTCRDCGAPVQRNSPRGIQFDLNPASGRLTHQCAKEAAMTTFATPATTDKPVIPIPAGVIKGPADADHYRVKVGRWGQRWYIDPLPACAIAPATEQQWPAFSHIKKASSQDWSFVSLKRIAVELDSNPDCLDGLDLDTRLARMNEINKRGLSRAMQRGTNVHTYLEMALRGHCEPTYVEGPNEPGAEYLPAVVDFLNTYQPELVAAEMVYVGRDLNGVGYAGTADGIIRIDGKTYWIDWKTRNAESSHGCYAEEAAQIAAGVTADYMIVEGDDGPQRQRIPQVDGGLIVSIKPDGVRLYPITVEAATPYWRSLHAFWVAQRDDKAGVGRQLPPRKSKAAKVAPDFTGLATIAADLDSLTALYQQAVAAGEWDDDLKAVFAARKQQLTSVAA